MKEEGTQIVWTPDEIQEWIENEIPSSTAKFFFFDGEQIQHFAYEEEENTKLKNSIELLLGIELYRNLRAHLEEYIVKKLRAETLQNYESEVLHFEADIKQLESTLQEITEETGGFENDLRQLKSQQKQLQDKQELLFAGFDAYSQSTRSSLTSELERRKDDLQKLQKEKKEHIQEYFPFTLLLDKLSKLRQSLLEQKESRIAYEAHSRLGEIINKIADECLTSSECVCGKQLTDSEKVTFKERFLYLIQSSSTFKKGGEASPMFNLSSEQELNVVEIIDDIWKTGPKVQELIETEIGLAPFSLTPRYLVSAAS